MSGTGRISPWHSYFLKIVGIPWSSIPFCDEDPAGILPAKHNDSTLSLQFGLSEDRVHIPKSFHDHCNPIQHGNVFWVYACGMIANSLMFPGRGTLAQLHLGMHMHAHLLVHVHI